jgi:hypothetical protein
MRRRVGPERAGDLGVRAAVDLAEAYNARALVGLIASKLAPQDSWTQHLLAPLASAASGSPGGCGSEPGGG